MTSRTTLNRRRFLRRSAALAAGTPLFGVQNILTARAPTEKLGIAVIGCGGQGGGNPGLAASHGCALTDLGHADRADRRGPRLA